LKDYFIKCDDNSITDIQEVVSWYDSIDSDITNRFLEQITFAESIIKNNPLIFGRSTKIRFGKYTLTRFPYKIYYRVSNTKIFIAALIHSSRSNKYFKLRLK
jgi:hypothetical protein